MRIADYVRFLEQRAEAAEALNNHLELAARKAEGVSEALRSKVEAAEGVSEALRSKVEAAEAKLAEMEKQERIISTLRAFNIRPIGGTEE